MVDWHPHELLQMWTSVGIPTMTVNQLNFCPTLHPTLLNVSRCAVGFFAHLTHTRLPWTRIPNQSIDLATIADSRSPFHLRTLPHPPAVRRHFSRSSSVDISGIYASYRATDLRTPNKATEVDDINRFCGLHDMRSRAPVAVVCMTSLFCSQCSLESRAFY